MRATAGLHGSHLTGIAHVRDIEDAYTTETLHADLFFYTLSAAIESTTRFLGRHEQQITVYRDIALPAWTHDRYIERRIGWIGNIVNVDTRVVANEYIVVAEGQIRVAHATTRFGFISQGEASRAGQRGQFLQIQDGFSSIIHAG